VPPRRSVAMTEALMAVAPGRPLREGLDRILQSKLGALIVVGDGPEVLSICSGGFLLDAELTPQRLAELAKMDGAIILDSKAERIARANVHLVPDPSVPTSETGTRHRTAERVARSIDVPVISISETMAVIAVYRGDEKHRLQPIPTLVARANQALQTLERYKNRLDAVSASLSALEVEDLVTLGDVATVLQRAEMVRRIAEEVDGYLLELGEEGRMLLLQLEELMSGVEDDRRLVVRDYLPVDNKEALDEAIRQLAELPTEELLNTSRVASILVKEGEQPVLDTALTPRGYRMLTRLHRLPDSAIEALVKRYGALSRALRATVEELQQLEGVGEERARIVQEGLARLAESSILERYG
jgi:diadenylate cyclase